MSLIESMPAEFNPAQFMEPLSHSHKALARQARKAHKDAKRAGPTPIIAKTERQAQYIRLLDAGADIFAVGGAGTGKTYLAARKLARKLIEGEIEKIIISRVTVSKAKHALGFLPGKLEQKLAPWLIPVFDGLRAEVSAATLDQWKSEGKVEIASFEHMRGRTFTAAGILLDEAQNADFGDLKLFLTRIGEGSQVVVTGDLDQIDVHNSGLEEVIALVERYGIPMEVVRFGSGDVVRSKIAKAFVQAFEAHNKAKQARASRPDEVQNLDTVEDLSDLSFMRPSGRA